MGTSTGLRFEYEWVDPGAARGAELRATWASFALFVADKTATECFDLSCRSVRDRVFIALYPLAEWFADHWWFIRAENESVNSPRAGTFERRHNIRWAREGFVLPAVSFASLGEHLTVQWQPSDFPDASIRFISWGSELIPARQALESIRQFVNAVVMRLDASGITGTTLHDQWVAIASATAEEQRFCEASARLGVDPYSVDDEFESALMDAASRVRHDLLSDFLSVANAPTLRAQAEEFQAATEAIAEDQDSFDPLEGLRSVAPQVQSFPNPWESGYRFAQQLRQALHVSPWKSRSLDDLAQHLRVENLERCLINEPLPWPAIDALVGSNIRQAPKFAIAKPRADSRQYAFCRALFEHLTLPRERFAMVNRLRTERQQMNRAFAAEFLAPWEMLQRDISASTIGEEEVSELAAEYGVSEFVIRHQLENHQLAQVSEY
ncbi:MAG: hypothetical protein R3C99_20525 [Pirellulaceae bacterium]